MNESKKLMGEKRAITPLWIVALFVSLTETVLGIAVTQTAGGIQVSLTVFVLTFPVVIAGAFFLVLWHKPYVFYPPTEFGHHINVGEYVEAMQRKPELTKQYKEVGAAQHQAIAEKPDSPVEVAGREGGEGEVAVSEILKHFIDTVSTTGIVILYACLLAHSKSKSFSAEELCSNLLIPNLEYAHGFMITVSSVGFVEIIESKGIWNVTFVHEIVRKRLPEELSERLLRYEKESATDETSKIIHERIVSDKKTIEEYFE